MPNELLKQIEEETGFHSYEASINYGVKGQLMFYGTSDKFNDFKTLAGNNFATGTIVYLLDTGDSYMYSKFKDTWY